MTSQKSVTKAASLMLVAILASRLLGLVRDMLIASKFGQTGVVSAYTNAFNLPDLLYFFLSSGALSSAFIPVFTERFKTGREKEAWEIFSIITCFMGLVLAGVIVFAWIFARPLVSAFVMPGNPKLVPLAIVLTRIILPCQFAFFVGGLMMGTLESRQKFSARASGPVIYNIGIIFGAIVLSRWFNIAGVAWGTLIGAFAGNILYAYHCLRKEGYEFYPSLNIKHPGVIQVAKLALPVILGLSLPQIDVIVNKWFATFLSDAAPAAINNANRLMQVPLGIFAQAAGTAILPVLSAYAAKKAYNDMRSTVGYGIRAIMLENIPSTIFMVILADPIVRLVYQKGLFNPSDTPLTATAFLFYSLGVFAWAGQAIVARGFFAMQDTVTPVVIGTVSTIIFLPLNYILMHTMGIAGLALATTIAAIIHFAALTYFLRKRLNGIEGTRILKQSTKVLIAAAIMGIVIFGIKTAVINYADTRPEGLLTARQVLNPSLLAQKLNVPSNEISKYISQRLSDETRNEIKPFVPIENTTNEAITITMKKVSNNIKQDIITDLNRILKDPQLYNESRFKGIELSARAQKMLSSNAVPTIQMNRRLLEEAYIDEIGLKRNGKMLSGIIVLLSMIIGGLVYFTSLKIMKVEEVDMVVGMIKSKFLRKKPTPGTDSDENIGEITESLPD